MISRGTFGIALFFVAFSLSACGGGGGSAPNLDARQHVGTAWGVSAETGLEGPVTIKATTDANDNVTRIEIKDRVFDRNCQETVDDVICEDASGAKGVLHDLDNRYYDYDYLVAGWWTEKGETLPREAFIGGLTSDRTPSNVKISGRYQGGTEMIVSPAKAERFYAEGKVNLTINNGKVSGSITDLEKTSLTNPNAPVEALPGRVSVDGTVNGNTLRASLSGNVAGENLITRKSGMNGGFFGPNGEEVGGGITGETDKGSVFHGYWHAKKK